MQTDRILSLFMTQGHEHISWRHARIFTDTPTRTINILKRAVETDDMKGLISVNLPGVGEVVDAPFIQLSENTILIIGNTWTAELTAESEAADAA
jgi:hypothetical protein